MINAVVLWLPPPRAGALCSRRVALAAGRGGGRLCSLGSVLRTGIFSRTVVLLPGAGALRSTRYSALGLPGLAPPVALATGRGGRLCSLGAVLRTGLLARTNLAPQLEVRAREPRSTPWSAFRQSGRTPRGASRTDAKTLNPAPPEPSAWANRSIGRWPLRARAGKCSDSACGPASERRPS